MRWRNFGRWQWSGVMYTYGTLSTQSKMKWKENENRVWRCKMNGFEAPLVTWRPRVRQSEPRFRWWMEMVWSEALWKVTGVRGHVYKCYLVHRFGYKPPSFQTGSCCQGNRHKWKSGKFLPPGRSTRKGGRCYTVRSPCEVYNGLEEKKSWERIRCLYW